MIFLNCSSIGNPILETTTTDKGDVVIVTGDNQGTFVRYTFTE